MTEDELVSMALSLPEAAESAHFGNRDFRVRGKIFMALPGRDREVCVLKLTPDQQQMALAIAAGHFSPVKGGWGRQGWTRFAHPVADGQLAHHWLDIAWRNVAPKRLIAAHDV